MKTTTKNLILAHIKKSGQASPKDLYNAFDISPRAIFKQLKNLLEQGDIKRIGQPPKVYYAINPISLTQDISNIPPDITALINERFYWISPLGQEETGLIGFSHWCWRQQLDISKTALEYIHTLKKYDAYKSNNLIDGMQKLNSTFKKVSLDHLFYLDFYAIERFGKTTLGQLLQLAKSSQNKKNILKLIKTITPAVQQLVSTYRIDTVGFIPATVKREVQFMNELKKHLPLTTSILPIVKAKTDVLIAQKTLNKLADRIENARGTIIVDATTPRHNILLIDDAVGSGATLNETAAQIKSKGLCQGQVIGLAIVGSFKGFDVISEV